MWSNTFGFGRQPAQTTLPCHDCGEPITVYRTCLRVHLQCPACKTRFPLESYINDMDEVLEEFLENVYCDRI